MTDSHNPKPYTPVRTRREIPPEIMRANLNESIRRERDNIRNAERHIGTRLARHADGSRNPSPRDPVLVKWQSRKRHAEAAIRQYQERLAALEQA